MESEATANEHEPPVIEKRRIGKLKAGFITCMIALIVLGGYNLVLQIQYQSLRDTNRKIGNQNLDYIDQLDDLNDDIRSLEAMYESLEVTHENYAESHWYTNYEYELARFRFYYSKPEHQRFGVYELEDELNALKWTEPYAEDVFDCSEMTACLEWHLENRGWHALFYAGDSPFGTGKHVWLLVEVSEGAYMPVECTTLRVVFWEDPNFDEYWEYEHIFETIQEATLHLSSDYDWWQLGFCPLDYS